MNTCNRCGAPIDWVQTTEGKWTPLDPEPVFVVENGGRDHFVTDEGQVITGRQARLEERSVKTPVAFVPHWKMCTWLRRRTSCAPY